MLIVPPLKRVGSSTVFGDDRSPSTFYAVPDLPRVKRDAQGAPALALTLYRLDEKTRAQTGNLGDANLRVDVDLALTDAERAAIAAEIQPIVPASSKGAQTVILDPPWSRCAARLSVAGPDGGAPVGDLAASILTGSLARFDVPLSVSGGVLLSSLFNAPASGGLGVTFDLAFFGRLPPIAVLTSADPGALYDVLRGASDGYDASGCTQQDLDALSARGLDAASLANSGVIQLRLDPGGETLDADRLAAIKHYALDRFASVVRDRFFTSFTREGATHYRLRSRGEATRAPLSLSVGAADVLEWPIAPQTSNLLEGLTASDLAPRVRTIELGDPFWDTLTLGVTVFADFGAAPIAFVAVDIQYDGGDATRAPFTATLVFQASGQRKTLPESPPLLNGVRTYRYQTKIAYVGRDARAVSPWTTTDLFDLDISVSDPAKLDVTVLVGDVDFSLVRSVVATLSYDDPEDGHVEHPLTLDAAARSASFTRFLSAPLAEPASVTSTFYLLDGTKLVGDPMHPVGGIAPVGLPAQSILHITLLLSGDLHDVAQALVELTYDDGAGFTTTADRRLKSLDDLQRWTVPLRVANKTSFRYSVEIDYHHRAPEVRDDVLAEGSQAVAIEVTAPPTLRVAIHPELVDFAAVPLVTVDLVHDGPSAAQATLPFTSMAIQTWETPLVAGEAASFSYAVTYHPSGRDAVALPPITSLASSVVIPALSPPALGSLKIRVLGGAIDFTVVDNVRVDVKLPGDTAPRASATLTDAEPSATITFPVPAGPPPTYLYTSTFTPRSGSPVTLPETTTDVPLLAPRLA